MRDHRTGFTLIEVLIVAVIVAVLAATIVPQFATSSKDAKMSNLKFNLHMVRSQLEVYRKDHHGAYPPATSTTEFSNQLTQKTTPSTTLDTSGTCGPYVQGSIPLNPFNKSTTVAIIQGNTPPTAPTGGSDGWQYSPHQGWFYPNNVEYFQSPGNSNNSD